MMDDELGGNGTIIAASFCTNNMRTPYASLYTLCVHHSLFSPYSLSIAIACLLLLTVMFLWYEKIYIHTMNRWRRFSSSIKQYFSS